MFRGVIVCRGVLPVGVALNCTDAAALAINAGVDQDLGVFVVGCLLAFLRHSPPIDASCA
jgi:hypothetical protein